MSDSVRPHRRQPTRLPGPWDSPGKNTGVGCHFLLQCMKVKSLCPVQLLATPWTAAYQAPPSLGFSRQEYWSGVPLPSPFERKTIEVKCHHKNTYCLHDLLLVVLTLIIWLRCVWYLYCKITLYYSIPVLSFGEISVCKTQT